MSLFPFYLSQMADSLANMFFLPLAGTIFEILLPGEKQTIPSRIRGVTCNAVYFVTAVALATLISAWIQLHKIPVLLPIDLTHAVDSMNPLLFIPAYTILAMLSIIVFDFFYYWYHRSQHVFGPMWRVHSVHHSLRELNLFDSYHHLLEPILMLVMVTIPMLLLVRMSVSEVAVVGFAVKLSDTLIHANSKLRYGPLRYMIAEPGYHRIHLSIEPQHWIKNFASYFPLWDICFGTAYFPSRHEWPRTGLSDQSEPRSVKDYALIPFRRS